MILNDVIEAILNSLKQDNRVQGSIGRGEQDEHSDIDLYCLVNEEDVEEFLQNRVRHLESYNKLLYYDDIFIVAPQIIAVYENFVHVDMYTVTERTYIEKDFMKVFFDPNNKLEKLNQNQNLKLSDQEFQDAVDDVAWFLFQYKKSADRGNDIWAVSMLHHVMTHLSRVLLHRYNPDRAQLGMKTIESSLPEGILKEIKQVYETMTPNKHKYAVQLICDLIASETEWVFSRVSDPGKISPFWERMISSFPQKNTSVNLRN